MVTRTARKHGVLVFGALAGPRLQVLECLRRGPVPCRETFGVVGPSRPRVSRHLAKLERAGVLVREKRETRSGYRIDRVLKNVSAQCIKEDGSWRTQ